MGVCTSSKDKNIKAQKKDKDKEEEKKDKDNDKKDSKTDEKDKEKEKEGNEEKNSKEEENKEKNSTTNENNEEKKEEKKEVKIFPEINFTIENKDNEYKEKVKSSEKISYLFTLISKYKEKKYSEYDLLTEEEICLSSKLNEEIGSVFPNQESVSLKMLYMGLELSFDVKKDYEVTTTLLGEPLFDLGGKIGLLIFHKYKNTFSSEIIKNQKLAKYNHLSAYCNCKNVLYICGGESEKNKNTNNRDFISNFTQIDLFNTESINELPMLDEPRAWHSMIFLPPKYIFIIGGDTKVVEIFDIDKKKLSPDSEMNEIRNECTLFCLNDSILYAFSGMSKAGSYLKNIEKCNLRQSKREWIIVKYKSNNCDFQDCYYISSFYKKPSELILFAANENENYNFDNLIFKIKEADGEGEGEEEEIIEEYDTDTKLVDVCPEKLFHPINSDTSVLIPLSSNTVTLYSIGKDMKLEKKSFPDALKQILD